MNARHVALVIVSIVGVSARAGSRFTDWSTPTNLGPAVNSAFAEAQPAVSKDGLSLYFASDRPGFGGQDLWVSQRSSVDQPWGPAVNLGPTLNTAAVDQSPALSRDGHLLFFATDRPGGLGGLDIWVSRRDHTHDDFAWQAPVPITEINSAVNDAGPSYLENEGGNPQLYFNSLRSGGAGLSDLYVTEQQDDGTWSAPTPVVELNTQFQEQRATIRFDGLEIIFGSSRPPSTIFDLWMSTRDSVTDPWSTPVQLNINSPAQDLTPYLSADGMTLYFSSGRPDGFGLTDLWVSTRERKRRNE
jgi:WD40-like Beta Propeller Repeat